MPSLPTPGALGSWLDLSPGELAWFADVRSIERTVPAGPLRHYRYRCLTKPSGGARLVEAPKLRLRELQRRLLSGILGEIPAHGAAHGFVAGRSPLSFVRPHVGAAVVVKVDLEDFFNSVRAGRIFAVFRTAGYPRAVAHLLTGLTTNVVPHSVWAAARRPPGDADIDRHYRIGRSLASPHLPQGAPTSPALANLCVFRLDRRLAGLAARFGLAYTRYADDLAFSGDVGAGTVARLIGLVGSIAAEEGFRVNHRKTRAVASARRQRLTGIVVNERPNLRRRDYDDLRATLHNAARTGLAAQNRTGHPDLAAHLRGRVTWAVTLNPDRRDRLGALLDRALAAGPG